LASGDFIGCEEDLSSMHCGKLENTKNLFQTSSI
jgi:hypothetical protein